MVGSASVQALEGHFSNRDCGLFVWSPDVLTKSVYQDSLVLFCDTFNIKRVYLAVDQEGFALLSPTDSLRIKLHKRLREIGTNPWAIIVGFRAGSLDTAWAMAQLESIIEFNRRDPDATYAGLLDDTEFYNDPRFDWVRCYLTESNLGPTYVDYIRKLHSRSQQVGLPLVLSCMQGKVLDPPAGLVAEGGFCAQDYELLYQIVSSPLQVQAYGNRVQYIEMRLKEAVAARQDNGKPVPLRLAAEFQHRDLIHHPNKDTITLYRVAESACDTLKDVVNAYEDSLSVDFHTNSGKAVAELLRRLQWPGDLCAVPVNLSSTAPDHVVLYQNYPNPFNSKTILTYAVPHVQAVQVKIYNMLGQLVCELEDGQHQAGTYRREWDGKNGAGNTLASGLYVYQVLGAKITQTKVMLLLR